MKRYLLLCIAICLFSSCAWNNTDRALFGTFLAGQIVNHKMTYDRIDDGLSSCAPIKISNTFSDISKIEVVCPQGYKLKVTFPYSENEFIQLQKEGKPWIAEFQCEYIKK